MHPMRRSANSTDGTPRQRALGSAIRLVGIADLPTDDDDALLRKRVGVVAGYLTIAAPLALPLQARGQPVSWLLALGLSLFAIGNLVVLARSRRFDRYVVALISAGLIFVPAAQVVGGGITGSSVGLVWGFLVPAYAIMALGPARAVRWFVAYLVVVLVMVIIDPWARDMFGPAPYELTVLAQVQNTVVPLTITFLLLRYTDVRRRAAEARADELLVNAIPRSIAARLKHGEQRIAESYPSTTVLFADLVGFTSWVQRVSPKRVIEQLDEMFTRFDELTAERGLEKIKTIGDAYMVAAGAPEPRVDHAQAAVDLGRDFLLAMAAWRDSSGLELDVRVGIASGPVVGGVIGQRRILFDLWGDTVNLASRMESSGLPGRIQVAASTQALLADRYTFEPRPVDVKGIGTLTAYVLVE
jgi:adenylate cyclase